MPATILIADDHESSRAGLEALLSLEGYNVLTAEDGIEALAGCGKSLNRDDSPPQGLKPSLILHDLRGAKAPLYRSAAGFRDFFRSLLDHHIRKSGLQNILRNIMLAKCLTLAVCISAQCQTVSSAPTLLPAKIKFTVFPGAQAGLTAFPTDAGSQDRGGSSDAQNPAERKPDGLIMRSIKRGLQDQKRLYAAPFKVSNLKWDALFLAGTAALLATDKRTQEALPGGNVNLYGNISNVSLGSMSGALVALWAYGIKTGNERANE